MDSVLPIAKREREAEKTEEKLHPFLSFLPAEYSGGHATRKENRLPEIENALSSSHIFLFPRIPLESSPLSHLDQIHSAVVGEAIVRCSFFFVQQEQTCSMPARGRDSLQVTVAIPSRSQYEILYT